MSVCYETADVPTSTIKPPDCKLSLYIRGPQNLFHYPLRAAMTSPRILIIYAHPGIEHSRANRAMIDVASALPQVQIHDLYQRYPDFYIDIAYEQAQLRQADLIILQHPIQWYSMPALQKEWLDRVLQRGWAFDTGANALHGKDFLLVATTGAEASAYQAGQRHGYHFAEFLPAYRQTARLCGMRWHAPLILHGAHRITGAALRLHAESYGALLARYPHWPVGETGDMAAAADTQ